MSLATAPDPIVAWPKTRDMGARNARLRTAIVAAAAVGAAAIVICILPSVSFRARAIVVVADSVSPLAAALPTMAAEVLTSERVLTRAAQSLNDAAFVDLPDPIARLQVTFGLDKAKSRAARRADELARRVSATPGKIPGTVEVAATNASPEVAASSATAVAEALVAEQAETMVRLSRKREAEDRARMEQLKADAATARSRLAALGGPEADPAEQRATAAVQTAGAQARVEAIRAIIGSSTPPLSDRRDVPSGIESLQASYLDLKRQLAKAQETLGDRHTTIIALKAELAHAAASLTTEWRRLLRIAEADLASKRQHEATLRQANTPADAHRREQFEVARRALQAADDDLARVKASQGKVTLETMPYRLVAPAAIPTVASGWSLAVRVALAGLAGALAGFVANVVLGRRVARTKLENSMVRVTDVGEKEHDQGDDEDATLDSPDTGDMGRRGDPLEEPRLMATCSQRRRPQIDLTSAIEALVPRFITLEPAFGPIPTIMIAANEAALDTTTAAVALGAALAAFDYRVLVVEAEHVTAKRLAESVDLESDPVVVDLFGLLSIAFAAEGSAGRVCVAPALPDGARMASDLARHGDVSIIDDLAAAFDVMVVDGGRAAECAEAGWGADVFVRVGNVVSRLHDDVFSNTFGAPVSALLGTVVDERFTLRAATRTPQPAEPIGFVIPSVRSRWASPTTRVTSVRASKPSRRAAGR